MHFTDIHIITCNDRPLIVLHSNILSAEGRLVTRLQAHSDKTHGHGRAEVKAMKVASREDADVPAYIPDVYINMGDEIEALKAAKTKLDHYFGDMLA